MFFSFQQHNGFGVLKLFGDFTSRNASKLKKAFIVGLSNSEHLIMDFRGISKIDDLFMKEIASLKEISVRAEKKLTIINFHHIQPDLGKFSYASVRMQSGCAGPF